MIENCFPQRSHTDKAVEIVVKNGFSIVQSAISRMVCKGPRGIVLQLDFACLTFTLKFADGVQLNSYMITGKVCRRKPEYFLADLRTLFRRLPLRDYSIDGRHAGTISEWFEDRELGFVECYGRRDFVLRIAQVPLEMRSLVKEGAKIRFRAGKLGPYRARHGCLPATDVVIVRTGVLVEMPARTGS